MPPKHPTPPLVPAKAGTQGHKHRSPAWALDSRFRGDERSVLQERIKPMMRIALSTLLVALGVTPAAAQITGYAPARLKSQATVSSEVVRIGDLIENAGAVANRPIFRAPDLGETGAVPLHAVLDALRPYGLLTVDA